MKYLDLFSGYGGFSLGIQQAYESTRSFNVSEERGGKKAEEGVNETGEGLHAISSETTLPTDDWNNELPNPSFNEGQPNCIGFCEIDKYATQVYKHKFPTHKEYGDITKLDPTTLPDFDLLTGGFPCQAFSIAGKRAGFEDTRGTLIFDVFRIIKEKHPRLVLLENVKGLLSHDQGRTFKTIVTSLAELGYAVEWQVLNAKNFGVPQNRERVFIVGHLGGFGGRQVFPIGGSNESHLREITKEVSDAQRIYNPKGLAKSQKALGGGLGAKTGLYAVRKNMGGFEPTKDEALCITKSYCKGFDNHGQRTGVMCVPVLTPDRIKKRQNGRRFKKDGEPRFTLTGQDKHGVFNGSRVRRLTPTECERLMGLPDGWTIEGTEGKISDTQRYKMAGNGVVINVVEEIIKKLIY